MAKKAVLKLDEIEIDEEIYPRHNVDWQDTWKYSQAMKAGAKFPPILVALFQKRYYLIDGRHRIEAVKRLKQDYIDCVIAKFKDRKAMYIEAVKLNVRHGKSLTTQDRVMIITKLQEFKLAESEISNIVAIPVDKIKPFVVKRVAHTLTGEPVALKAPITHLAGTEVPDDIEEQSKIISSRGDYQIYDQFIQLLENKLYNLRDKKVKAKLLHIKRLLAKMKLSI